MATHDAAVDFIDKEIAGLHKLAEFVSQELEKESRTTIENANKDFGEWESSWILDEFNDSVTRFYDAYTPKIYKRQGNTSTASGGLYNVLDIQFDENSMVLLSGDGYDSLYDKDKMPKDRDGFNSLYDTVFVRGYHGGATKIASDKEAIWGAHPSPGTPYWRKPGVVVDPETGRSFRYQYAKWGKQAKKTTSVYEFMIRKINRAFSADGEFKRASYGFLKQHNDKMIATVRKKMPQWYREIVG